ncbi:hypothetical protein D3C87_1699710 [compost metagenome]
MTSSVEPLLLEDGVDPHAGLGLLPATTPSHRDASEDGVGRRSPLRHFQHPGGHFIGDVFRPLEGRLEQLARTPVGEDDIGRLGDLDLARRG